MTEASGSAFPVPVGLSAQAHEVLARPLPAPMAFPELTDTEEWLRHIEQVDRQIAGMFPADLPVHVEETSLGGVHTYVLRADSTPEEDGGPILLDLHGGALVYGGGDLCRIMAAPRALASGMTSWAVDYRMPPLHPFPAGLNDVTAVYRALLEVRAPEDIFVSGGSAGGNLAAALMLRLKDEGLPSPAALVLLSPEVDLTESGDTVNTLAPSSGSMILRPINLLYADGRDLAEPYLSPLFGDLTGFPPTFLQAGTRDPFLSNTVRMHRRLRAAGIEAELHVFEAMPHGGFGGAPEDLEVSAELRRFLDRHRTSRPGGMSARATGRHPRV